MRTRWIVLLMFVIACGGDKRADKHGHDEKGEHGEHDDEHGKKDEHADEHGTKGEHDEHEKEGEHGEENQVRIAPEMIRDLRVTTSKAESRAAGERVSALGELHVNQDTYAEVASPSPARVVKVLAKAGDIVKANQPLVELHSADIGKARAEVQAASSRVDVARANLQRKRKLAADRLIAEREVIEAEAAVTEAEASQRVAAAALRQFSGAQGASGLVLRSPVAGTVIARDVAVGQLADPSRTLYRIGDLSHLWLVAHVFERDAVRIRIGGTGTATFAALPGRTVDGTISWIGSEVDPSSRTISVRLDIPNADSVLRPGMSATVTIALGGETGTVVAVPMAAVQRVGDSWAVFLPRGEGVFDIRPIGRGRDLGGEVEVLSGLAPNDEVVVDGAFLLKAEADKARGEGGGHDHGH
jgi:cobalt-zinc-cadmium efflux system membrane fusion protein